MMTETEQRIAATAFAEAWAGRGYEKGESQPFWLGLLGKVFGVRDPERFIRFEGQVKLDHTSFIDGFIPSTHVLIEQKGLGKDLRAPIRQSDGSLLTPFQQAKRYAAELPYSERPRYIVVCNFATFLIYDMECPQGDPEELRLADLPHDFPRLSFLTQGADHAHLRREARLSVRAGELVGALYEALLSRVLTPDAPGTLRSLNILCVRLVFCLYAEDAGLFGRHACFHDYLHRFEPRDLRRALIDLFATLNTPPDRRDPYLDPELAAFPYVNGGLFAEEAIEIPPFDAAMKELLLAKASDGFDWSGISPTIFGAVFESTLNPATRRQGGMHYTSVENIHKVIDPLFLDALRGELDGLCRLTVTAVRERRLRAFQEKLASLTFLDPACGSGNFLTETYLSLRRLENDLLRTLHADQMLLDVGDPIRVSIRQLHGIEVNDFAVTVARTALWIAEAQTLRETEDIVRRAIDFFPLRSAAHIVEANALDTPWPATHYIVGNPPFVGARLMTPGQKADVMRIFRGMKGCGDLDYVTCWYRLAANAMRERPETRAAFVSTNSIAQGIQPALLWKPLYAEGFKINFGVPTFRWDSESLGMAAVHCVIVGFSLQGENKLTPYLTEGDPIVVESRSKPLCDVPAIGIGNKPIDGGNYLFSDEEKALFLAKEPAAAPYFRKWLGADEFINGWHRWCLWLGECPPNELRAMPEVLKRVQAVRELRLASKSAGTRKLAATPTRFHVENMPKGNSIIVPEVSSERRAYIPMGFIEPTVLCSNRVRLIPDASLWHFGVLNSSVHNAWIRAVCGRLEMRYVYSNHIVYNNFPWPEADDAAREKVAALAQGILDARAVHPGASLADLYDPNTMPPALIKAHLALDRAVLALYGLKPNTPEPDIVRFLLRRYAQLMREA